MKFYYLIKKKKKTRQRYSERTLVFAVGSKFLVCKYPYFELKF